MAVGLLCLAGCSKETESEKTGSSVNLEMRVNGGTSGYDFATHMNRIYIGENKHEHGVEELHVNTIVDLYPESGKLRYRGLGFTPNFYKFVVLSVPKVMEGTNARNFDIFTEKNPGEGSCNMNDHLIDYSVILKKGPGAEANTTTMPLPDGDIFRSVLNRALVSHQILSEDIVLHRLNGLLEIDMGILADQFEEKVNKITVQMVTPTCLYILDENKDKVITAKNSQVSFVTTPLDMRSYAENQRKHHIIRMNLLPGEIDEGQIIVETESKTFNYTLVPVSGKLFIKRNTRTKLKFNGIPDDSFEVIYAGYEDTKIDAEDEWKEEGK